MAVWHYFGSNCWLSHSRWYRKNWGCSGYFSATDGSNLFYSLHLGNARQIYRNTRGNWDDCDFFNPQAVAGGTLGAIVIGFQRAVFSNEAGIGSAAIAHSAARTKEPIREGIVALLEPFIDTMFICNMTAMVIVLTGVYADPTSAELDGARLSAASFETIIGWFPYVIAVAGFLFAVSTMISWSYYGQLAWGFMFGDRTVNIYKVLFLTCGFIGTVINLDLVLEFSDILLLAMSLPNLLGCFMLSGIIARDLDDYMTRLSSGQMLATVADTREPILK